MSRILVIAGNTFREVIRDRIFYVLVFFAAVLIAVSKALGWISIGHDTRVIADFSLAAIQLLAMTITVFLGANLVYKEIEKRTLYSVLSKDVGRWQFVLGKYAGLVATASLCVVGMGAIFFLYLLAMGGTPTGAMGVALYGILLELALVTALSLFLSSLTSPILAAIATFVLFLAGHSVEIIRDYMTVTQKGDSDLLLLVSYYVLPNLENFNFKNYVGAPAPPPGEFILLATAYGVVYAGALLALTLLVYRRKDF